MLEFAAGVFVGWIVFKQPEFAKAWWEAIKAKFFKKSDTPTE